MEKLNFTEKDRIGIIAPHPDDECLGAFAPMQFLPKQTDVIVVSDGSHGNTNVSIEKEAVIRHTQFENEMKEISLSDCIWLGYEDTTLSMHPEMLNDVDLTKYTMLFIPWEDSYHPDHRAVFQAVIKQIQKQGSKARLFSYEINAPFRRPTHYIDITEFIDKKLHLIRIHQDQVSSYCQDMVTITLNKFRACQANSPKSYYECYIEVENPCSSRNR